MSRTLLKAFNPPVLPPSHVGFLLVSLESGTYENDLGYYQCHS